MIDFWNKLPGPVQQVLLLGAVMGILVVANNVMAEDPSWDDSMRGVVQAVIVRALSLVGISIEKKP